MTFTDDDMVELKELTKAALYWSPKIPALLARLEASERCVVQFRRHGIEDEEVYLKWLKSCGR